MENMSNSASFVSELRWPASKMAFVLHFFKTFSLETITENEFMNFLPEFYEPNFLRCDGWGMLLESILS